MDRVSLWSDIDSRYSFSEITDEVQSRPRNIPIAPEEMKFPHRGAK